MTLLGGGGHRLTCGTVIGDILQPTHLLFILVVALLVLGPKRLPEVGRALGRGLRDFRNALNTDDLSEQMLSTTSTQGSEAATAVIAETPPGQPAPQPEVSAESDEPAPPPEPATSAPAPDRAS